MRPGHQASDHASDHVSEHVSEQPRRDHRPHRPETGSPHRAPADGGVALALAPADGGRRGAVRGA